jgi:hypothetical protein
VDVILAASIEAARSAKVAAPGVPTVFLISGDPVLEGLVTSLSRPQGNLTGLITRGEELTGKASSFSRRRFPQSARSRSSDPTSASRERVRRAARSSAEHPAVSDPRPQRLSRTRRGDRRSDRRRGPRRRGRRCRDEHAAFTRLMMATRRPVMFNADVFVEGDGFGLMAYGVSLRQQYRRAADFVARCSKAPDLRIFPSSNLRATSSS